MKRVAPFLMLVAAALSVDAAAQAVPEYSQAARIDAGYLRPPHFRVDPFRHVMIPHWGFVISLGASGQNNTLNFKDMGAISFLSDEDNNADGLLLGDVLDILGLVPTGSGLRFSGDAGGGVYLGGPFGRYFGLGAQVQVRAYGGGSLDDDFVALLRDGNGAREEFTLGDSRGAVMVAAEYGGHAVVRLGPISTVDGPRLSLGFGGRYVIPHFFARAGSTLENGGVIRVSGDTMEARIGLEYGVAITGSAGGWEDADVEDMIKRRGQGIAADFLVRLEWPTSGFALEAMAANIGKVTVWNVENKEWALNVATTEFDVIRDSLDAFPEDLYPDSTGVQFKEFAVQDTTEELEVTLPRIIRFSGSAWANRILQLDLSATLPYSGSDFHMPLTVDLGSTWRFSRTLPIRLGLVFGGNQGLGYTGGIGIESRNFLLRFAGGSLGGFVQNATGVSGRFELGFFF